MNTYPDAAVRSLDAAVAELTAGQHARALATLERIVASTPSDATPFALPTRRQSVRRRLFPVAAGILALIVGSIAVNGTGRERGGVAYASWTAAPSPVSRHDVEVAAEACRGYLRRQWDPADQPLPEGVRRPPLDMDRATLAVTERRGDYVSLLYLTDSVSAACVVRNAAGSTEVDIVATGGGGSAGPALVPATSYTRGSAFQFPGGSLIDGAVGSNVTAVTIHADKLKVKATVANGRYAAWWPGQAYEEFRQRDGRTGYRINLTYDLTLSDGTVIHNAKPARPSG
jgi:hypothetical protein